MLQVVFLGCLSDSLEIIYPINLFFYFLTAKIVLSELVKTQEKFLKFLFTLCA